ncbi:MAG TPA: hypothetical protein VF345_11915 [Chthoniobacterales bacterium]
MTKRYRTPLLLVIEDYGFEQEQEEEEEEEEEEEHEFARALPFHDSPSGTE